MQVVKEKYIFEENIGFGLEGTCFDYKLRLCYILLNLPWKSFGQ